MININISTYVDLMLKIAAMRSPSLFKCWENIGERVIPEADCGKRQ